MTTETAFVVEYNSNNSGGGWWLKDDDWQTLERDGWTVVWLGLSFCHSKFGNFGNSGRPAPETCESDRTCPGHRGADSYEEAVAAGSDARWLGCLAREATIEVNAYSSELAEGVAELWWGEALPSQDAKDEGCNCCGNPHNFYAREKATVPA